MRLPCRFGVNVVNIFHHRGYVFDYHSIAVAIRQFQDMSYKLIKCG